MLCDDCGHENPPDLQFCEDCNSKLGISQIQKNTEIQEITQIQEITKIREIPQKHEQTTYEDKEITSYSDDKGVRITNKRAIFENKSYDLTNILSISLHVEDPYRNPAIISFVIGGLLLLFNQWWGVILLFGGPLIWALSPKKYSIRMFRSSGETDILSIPNKVYVQNIIDKMNEAIKRRG